MKPAARVGDATTHGAPLSPGPGSHNVLIGNRPAWRAAIDQHACPAVSPSGADGVGSVVVGSPSVLINNQMACRVGDVVVEKPGAALGPINPIIVGEPTVLIGEGGIASQIAVTVTAMRSAAKTGLPLIQICPECKLLAALAGLIKLPLGDVIAAGKNLYDAIRNLINPINLFSLATRVSRAGTRAWLFSPDNPLEVMRKAGMRAAILTAYRRAQHSLEAMRKAGMRAVPLDAVKKAAASATAFDWQRGAGAAGMGALKTALNNLNDLKQGKHAAFAAKVGYGALRGLAGEAVGSLAVKGGVVLGTVFPPAGGALGGSAIGKTIGGLIGGKKGEIVGGVVGAILGGAVGAIPGVGHAAGIVLGAIGAQMWASEITESAIDKITGGEEKVGRFFNRGP